MDALHQHVLQQFQLIGTPVSCERYGFGHINETYLVVTDQRLRYILQKINKFVWFFLIMTMFIIFSFTFPFLLYVLKVYVPLLLTLYE